jgi:hypothetical protein
MDIATLLHIIVRQWAVLMAAPIPFIAAGALGLVVGYGFAWIILRNRLTHHQELVAYYKDVAADKLPSKSSVIQSGQRIANSRSMSFGLGLMIIGLVIAVIGGIVVFIERPSVAAVASTSKDRSATKTQLQTFYIKMGEMIDTPLNKDISAEDFEKYKTDSDKTLTEMANWIKENMGEAALARFADRSGMSQVWYSRAANDTHNAMLMNQTRIRLNLLAMIESSAWDKN